MTQGMQQKMVQSKIPLQQPRSILEVLQAAPDMDRLPSYRNTNTQEISGWDSLRPGILLDNDEVNSLFARRYFQIREAELE
jgi:hypothetical protein